MYSTLNEIMNHIVSAHKVNKKMSLLHYKVYLLLLCCQFPLICSRLHWIKDHIRDEQISIKFTKKLRIKSQVLLLFLNMSKVPDILSTRFEREIQLIIFFSR